MIWAIAIIAIVGYAGAVTVALLRALKRARKVEQLEAALALEKEHRRLEKAAALAMIASYKNEIIKLKDLINSVRSGGGLSQSGIK